jgi:hypothetical protein
MLRSANPPTTILAIEKFEDKHGLTLPERYKQFLLTSNGGVPETPAFPIEGFASNPLGAIQVFFGIDARLPTSDLVQVCDMYRGGFPEGIVPIACTDGDDFVCLDLRSGSDRVAFWDKRHFWGTGEWRERDLYHVADSFEEFLATLRPNPY